MRRCSDQQQVPQFTGYHCGVRRSVSGIEPPLEPDLHGDPCSRDFVADFGERPELERNRLLAERRHPGRGRQAEHGNVARCARRDHERVDAIRDEPLWSRRRARTERGGQLGGTLGVGVRQEERNALERAEGLSMESADPADTDDRDTE